METIETLDTQPFKNLVMSIGALPSSFVDSMSYYEALAWLVKYLETQVIPAVNNNAEALDELQTAFVTLKDYVDHYFDNLDVQEEVNSKLDAMALDGTLAELINQEIFGEIQEHLSNIDTTLSTKLPQYKPLTVVNTLSAQFPINTSVQGFCVDPNNIAYVYVYRGNQYGDLYKYNLTSHAYIDRIQNLKLHHGNDMIYKNDKIYVATVTDDDNNNINKTIDVYDVNLGTISILNPFGSVPQARVECLCDYDENHIIVGFCTYSASSDTNDLVPYKFNLNTLEYERITLHWFAEVTPSRIVSMNFINGKLYLLTDNPEYMFEMVYNDTTKDAYNTKIYKLPKFNDNGTSIGEPEGLTNFTSGLYGDKTLDYYE